MASAVPSPERRRYRPAIHALATLAELKVHRGVIRRGALEAGAVVGAPRGHHCDVLRVKGCSRGRGESRVRMSRVRVSRVRMTRTGVRTHRRRGAARVAGERVMRRVCLHPVLPGRRLLPCRRGRGREGVILRRRGRDRRPRRRDVDGRLELLAVLLLLLLLRLLVIGTSAVPATSAPVEHSLPPRATTAACVISQRLAFLSRRNLFGPDYMLVIGTNM